MSKSIVTTVDTVSPRSSLSLFLKMLRVKQWTKNGLLFAGIIFVGQVFIPDRLIKVILATIAFCLISSALYIFNDLLDLEKDRNHPRKKFRPLASGAITIPTGIVVGLISGLLGLSLAFGLDRLFFGAALVYVGITMAYSWGLKRLVIIDVMTLAAGFVLRAVAGALVIHVKISPWLLVCTLLLALFLALTKRRQELKFSGTSQSRAVLESYTVEFLDQVITIVTAATLTSYFLYTFSAHTQWLMLTIPFVLYGIFRYLLLTHRTGAGEEPEQILISDWPFLINILLWLACSGIIISLK